METHFLKAVCILFGFCFRLNISTSEISNLLLPLGVKGVGSVNLDIPYFSLLCLVAFVLKHNVDAQNMQNIDVRIHVKPELQEMLIQHICYANLMSN